ncbi:WD40-repeat-containing domain protein [Abortiporus biennis]|nr:WD40-repeat-containing domain protein [Abortiporus biennis]
MATEMADWDFKKRLRTLKTLFQVVSAEVVSNKEGVERRKRALLTILRETIDVVRNADNDGYPDLKDIVEQANLLCNAAIAQGDRIFNSFPSFSDSEDAPIVKDDYEILGGKQTMEYVLSVINKVPSKDGVPLKVPSPGPWTKSKPPHPRTNPLSRFRDPVTLTATASEPTTHTIYQGLCEIHHERIELPTKIQISPDNSLIAISCSAGKQLDESVLRLYFPGQTNVSSTRFELGLEDSSREVAIDAERKLIFVADKERVKSYTWGEGPNGPTLKAVHTLRTPGRYEGSINILPSGRVIRFGTGSVLVWKIDDLETHGEDGTKRIGQGTFNIENSRRSPESRSKVELSTGTKAHGKITFKDDPNYQVKNSVWHNPSRHLLCSEGGPIGSRFSCTALDLEHGGKIVNRYLGFGGSIPHISLSEGDPNTFVTACQDGYVRIHDIRHPCPVIALDAEADSILAVLAATYAHPDGIPTVFTGGNNSETVAVWDIRARKLVYDLSTGNTSVTTMVWDSTRSTLYAGTTGMYINDNSEDHGYRAADIPSYLQSEYSESKDEPILWPKKSPHKENFYGRLFDAGGSSFLRYDFREDANPTVIPRSGRPSESFN